MTISATATAPSFMAGGGRMGELLRSHDWTTSPLGPPEAWPQPLKTLVALMLGSNQPMFIAWGETQIFLYNDAYIEILAGKHPALGMPFLDVWSEIRDDLVPIVSEAFAGRPVHMDDITLMMLRKGYLEEAHFAFSYTPVRDEAGQVMGLYCACTETTAQVQAERQLRESESRLRSVIDGMAEGFILLDSEFRIVDINAEGMRLESRPREAIVGKSHWEAWPGTEESELGRLYKVAMAERRPVAMEHRYTWPDGQDAWLDMRAYPAGGGLALFYRDVTERRRTENLARESAERIELALDSGAILGTWVWDVVTDRFVADQRFANSFGLDPQLCARGIPLEEVTGSIHEEDRDRVLEAVADAMQRGGHYRCEYRVLGNDGQYHWIEANGRVELGEDGRPQRFPGVLVDIEDRHRAERALRESEARLRVAQATGGIGTFELLPETGRILVSEEFCRLWGVPPVAEMDVNYFLDLIHPDDRQRVSTGERILPNHALAPTEYRIVRPDSGETRWIARRGEAIRDESTGATRYLGVCYDITDRKQAEEALREREGQLSAFVAQSTAGFAQVDLGGKFTFVNDRFCEIAGRSREELMTLTMQSITHPDDLVANLPNFQRAVAEGTPFVQEKRYIRPDGSTIWVNNSVSVIRRKSGEPYGVLAISIDVSERREAEAAVRENEARLRALTDNLPAGMVYQVCTGEDGSERRFQFISQSCEKLTGHTAEALVADPSIAYEMIHPDDRPMLGEAEARAIESRTPLDVQVRFHRADGELRWGRIISAPREASGGGLIWDGIKIDITDLKQAESLLLDVNATLEQRVADRTAERDRAWRNTQDLLVTVGHDGILHEVNPAWTKLLGYSPAETKGRSFHEFIHADDLQPTLAALALATEGPIPPIENRYRRKDGSYCWISWIGASEGSFVYASGRDITAEKEAAHELSLAQEALRQSQKMEAMGQLTGGVAHDFNNLLTPIIGSLDFLQHKAGVTAREQRLIEGALQSAERARTLVQRLLAFARRQPLQPTAVDVVELIGGMADLVDSTTGPDVHVESRVDPHTPAAMADANQLEMAILNLAVNARDAMPDGGTITIGAAPAHVPEGHASALAAGDYVRISIEDSGSGMDEATLARAVEPFFSTKGVGRGTGLGLSMVHGLAAQLGGALTLDSAPGQGTRATLWLQIASERPVASRVAGQQPPLDSHVGTALLVDDEALVRASAADMLSGIGFDVVEAGSGPEALDMLGGRKVDLIVTDHLMPGMSGSELADEVRGRGLDIPLLIISGYADIEGLPAHLPRLTKPFRRADLAAAIGSIMPKPGDR